jgi:hypothetical protein
MIKELLKKLALYNPQDLKLVSDGYGEFPDGYKLTDRGIEEIEKLVNEHTSKLYTEEEVRALLDMQRGNCYVAVYNKTLNTEMASFASAAPEPKGKDGWVKK